MFTNINRKLSFNRNEKLMTFKHLNFVKCTMYLWMKTKFPNTFVPNKYYYIILVLDYLNYLLIWIL